MAPADSIYSAELTYAIGRHAVADLAYTYRCNVVPLERDRLESAALAELARRLEAAGLPLSGGDGTEERLRELRDGYEKHVTALARRLALNLPEWLAPEEVETNWRRASARQERRSLLP